MCTCVPSHFSCVQLFMTLWTVAHQVPLSMGFSRQECWNGLPCPPPGDLPNIGMEPASLRFPELGGGFLLVLFFVFLPLAPPGRSDDKESTYKAGDPGLIPGSVRSPGEGNGYPF